MLQEKKPGYLYALAMLMILAGLVLGWGWRQIFAIPGVTVPHDYGLNAGPVALVASPTAVSQKSAANQALEQKPSPTRTVTPIVNLAYLSQDTGSLLLIPSIGVKAAIENVGVTANGSLDVPKLRPWDGVGVYQAGPQPGEAGSAVIDGHLERPGGAPAVFAKLRNVQVGDYIVIQSRDGAERRFRVEDIRAYPPAHAPVDTIFGDMSNAYLNLITCDNTPTTATQQEALRLVVHAVLSQ